MIMWADIVDWFYEHISDPVLDHIMWLDQRINVNEGVIALIALLVGVGMQNFKGARRIAGIGFIAISLILGIAAIYEGSTRSIRGFYPYKVVVPNLFRNSHGDRSSTIVYDNGGENSVQLTSSDVAMSVRDYLSLNCITPFQDRNAQLAENTRFVAQLAKINQIPASGIVLFDDYSRKQLSRPDRGICKFSWDYGTPAIDHWEVYVAIPSRDDPTKTRVAHLHVRAKKPTNVMIAADYRRMYDSLHHALDQ
jgi:hypothetical protein